MSDLATNRYKNLLRQYDVCLPIRAQKGEDCWANAAASLLSFELQRTSNSPNRKRICVSVQHLVDHTHRRPRGLGYIEFFKYTNEGRNYEKCPYPHKADFHSADGFAPLHYAQLYGVCHESDYPYNDGKFNRKTTIPDGVKKVKVDQVIEARCYDDVKDAIDNGHPVLGYIPLYKSFKYFKGKKIYTSNGEMSKDNDGHIILIVGYGIDRGEKYYIIQNSWGGDWADHGLAKVACRHITPNCYAIGVYNEEPLETPPECKKKKLPPPPKNTTWNQKEATLQKVSVPQPEERPNHKYF